MATGRPCRPNFQERAREGYDSGTKARQILLPRVAGFFFLVVVVVEVVGIRHFCRCSPHLGQHLGS